LWFHFHLLKKISRKYYHQSDQAGVMKSDFGENFYRVTSPLNGLLVFELRRRRAKVIQRAGRAVGFTGVADFAAQTDDVEMRGSVSLRVEQSGQVRVCLVGIHSWRAQSQAAAHAVNVGVYRKRGYPQ
jgi:hypothetical protein